jgi:hypothetical protein
MRRSESKYSATLGRTTPRVQPRGGFVFPAQERSLRKPARRATLRHPINIFKKISCTPCAFPRLRYKCNRTGNGCQSVLRRSFGREDNECLSLGKVPLSAARDFHSHTLEVEMNASAFCNVPSPPRFALPILGGEPPDPPAKSCGHSAQESGRVPPGQRGASGHETTRTEFGVARSSCACKECQFFCKVLPGKLIPRGPRSAGPSR